MSADCCRNPTVERLPRQPGSAQGRALCASIGLVMMLLACPLQSSVAEDVSFDGERSLQHVKRMVELGQRHYGAPLRSAAISQLARALEEHVDHVQQQRLKARERVSAVEYELVNIIGRRNPEASPRILLGSHYDTRVWAEEDADPTRRQSPIV